MAALLSVTAGKKDNEGENKQIKYMNEAEQMGISILQADINESNSDWTPNRLEKQLRYGLSSIAKITSSDYEMIHKYRPFIDFADFLTKNEVMKIKKDKIEMLIKSGAFDSITTNRNKLLRDYYMNRGEAYEHIPTTTSKRTIMEYEREAFGTNITVKTRWEKVEDGKENVSLTGMITMFELWTAKSGKTHGRGVIATNEDIVKFVIWGYKLDQDDNHEKLKVSNKVTLRGTKSGEEMVVEGVTFKAGMLNGEYYGEENPSQEIDELGKTLIQQNEEARRLVEIEGVHYTGYSNNHTNNLHSFTDYTYN